MSVSYGESVMGGGPPRAGSDAGCSLGGCRDAAAGRPNPLWGRRLGPPWRCRSGRTAGRDGGCSHIIIYASPDRGTRAEGSLLLNGCLPKWSLCEKKASKYLRVYWINRIFAAKIPSLHKRTLHSQKSYSTLIASVRGVAFERCRPPYGPCRRFAVSLPVACAAAAALSCRWPGKAPGPGWPCRQVRAARRWGLGAVWAQLSNILTSAMLSRPRARIALPSGPFGSAEAPVSPHDTGRMAWSYGICGQPAECQAVGRECRLLAQRVTYFYTIRLCQPPQVASTAVADAPPAVADCCFRAIKSAGGDTPYAYIRYLCK